MPNAKTTMRKYILTILILTTWATVSKGQNLVPNPSFEIYSTCPTNSGQIDYATPWGGPTSASSDLFNSCSTSSWVGVPSNCDIYGGYQFPRTGNGYAGFLGSCPFDIREYVQVQLIDTLTSGVTYRVLFYVNLANTERYGIDAIGACITQTAISGSPGYVLNYTPQVSTPVGIFLTDTLNWMEITGTFIATGGEKYLTIGNFKNEINTNEVIVNPTAYDTSSSYYYIDDVMLFPDSITVINEQFNLNNYKIYPNPTNQLATLEFKNPTKLNCTLTLYDFRGRVARTINNITTDKVEIERQSLANGLYFFQLRTDRQIIATGKLIIE